MIRPLLALTAAVAAACQGTPASVAGLPPAALPALIAPANFEGRPGAELPERGYIDFAVMPDTDVAQLILRRSYFARRFAVHPYFRVFRAEAGQWDQWEVWAGDLEGWRDHEKTSTRKASDGRPDEKVGAAERQFGTVRKLENLTYLADRDPDQVRAVWTGARARRIIDALERPTDYPHVDRYRIWPGPNSNTYAAWVLREAGIALDLGPLMVGKDWGSLFGAGIGLSPTRTGLRLDLPGVGAAVGLGDGVELHLLGATFGLDLVPPAIETPLGRVGVPPVGSL